VELKAVVLDRHGELAELAAGLRSLVTDLRQQGRTAQNRIVIASQHSVAVSVAPSIVRRLTLAHDLKIRLRSSNREGCCALLLTRQADVALLYVTKERPLEIDAEFVELKVIRSENLIPVYAAPLAKDLEAVLVQGLIPAVVYPSDVFLGKVISDSIFPMLLRNFALTPRVETALTLAAVQMALAGVGVAWVPETLAHPHIRSRRLADLRATLGEHRLQLVATRGKGKKSRVKEEYWQTIIAEVSLC
jgi:DNA-binding transcriptional LysR family regulator